jgi:polysaccharide biosynthesis protein PelA
MKKFLILLMTITAFLNVAFATTCKENPLYCQWLIYYNTQGTPSDFQPYNPIVFDSVNHPDIGSLNNVKQVLGRLSLGEITVTSNYFTNAQNAGVLIAPNANSPGSWYVDIRKPAWSELLLNTIIPYILNQGFNGLLLDTLDHSLYLAQINPSAYSGMTPAAVTLVKAIRAAYPNLTLMINRAYSILDQVGGSVNYALGSAVLTQPNPNNGRYYYTTVREYTSQINALKNAKTLFPQLTLFSLDFWNASDTFTLSSIYRQEFQNGFRPYVGEAHLQSIVSAP